MVARPRTDTPALALALLLASSLLAAEQVPSPTLRGTVRDASGAPLRARVRLGGFEVLADAQGRFALPLSPGAAVLEAEAPGFQRASLAVAPATAEVAVVLWPAGPSEHVTVTATRTETRAADTPASVVVLGPAQLAATSAVTLDDTLRQVPGFGLFRRSGSRVANPTTAGVSLRGVGASGAGRALVLDDGVPLNDPFGGWVYWGRVPRAAVERVEVAQGGGSDLWGSGALGGVVGIVRSAEVPGVALEASGGTQETWAGTLRGTARQGDWTGTVAAQGLTTAGYRLVAPAARGPVDTPASSRQGVVELTVARLSDGGARLFARGGLFGESRHNGTPLQVNDTRAASLVGGADWSGGGGAFSARVHLASQRFDQDFSAVAADRGSEALTRRQHTPAAGAGASVQHVRALGGRHTLVAGVEVRQATGQPRDTVVATGTTTSVDGRQRLAGVYVEGVASLGPFSATATVRLDGWWNRGTRGDGAGEQALPAHREAALSPRLSLAWKAGGRWGAQASVYRAFRAPTLNELYRPFRVGDVLTLANEGLRAERLTGLEAGLRLTRGPVRGRLTAFHLRVEDPVTNRTLSVTPGLVTRRRDNLGQARSRGLEIELDAPLGRRVVASAGYLLADAEVTRAASADLVGRRIPQVARHQLAAQLTATRLPGRLGGGVQARWVGRQYDDDLNRLLLRSYLSVDALLSHDLPGRFTVFVAGENLGGVRFDVGRTPTLTVGPPRSFRVGLRLRPGSAPAEAGAGRP